MKTTLFVFLILIVTVPTTAAADGFKVLAKKAKERVEERVTDAVADAVARRAAREAEEATERVLSGSSEARSTDSTDSDSSAETGQPNPSDMESASR